jgi:hypothetical protein
VFVLGGVPVVSQGIALATVLDPNQSGLGRGTAAVALLVGIVTSGIGSKVAQSALGEGARVLGELPWTTRSVGE